MISKSFKISSTIFAFVGIAAFIFFQQALKDDELGGFKEGTEQYNGYFYARDNKLKSADQCDDEKDDLEMNINEKFIQGCQKFFKK